MFDVTHKCGKARTGILTTKTGKYETPFFMPVATKAAARYLTTEDLEDIGIRTIISNAFLLYLKPGLDLLQKNGDIHEFMGWPHCSFTDSGGFQALSLKSFKGSFTDKGLEFTSPYDGSHHVLSPKSVMDIQQRIGADVAMVLDHMPLYGDSEAEVKEATERTHRWAEECLKHHTDTSQLLFGICQGGLNEDLRKKSARFISSLPFDGIAVGGVAIGEPVSEIEKVVKVSVAEIPEDKPRYLMGVGSPKEIIASVKMGIDMFDSVWPTRLARHGTALTKKGTISLDKGRYTDDMNPVDETCDCKICKKYDRRYLSHLIRLQIPLGYILLSYHNVYFLQKLFEKMRSAIREDTWEALEEEYKDV